MDPVPVSDDEPRVTIGAAAQLPEQLTKVLSQYLARRPVVEEARAGWIAYPDGRSGFLLVLVAKDPEAAMRGFESVALDDLIGDESLDVMVVPPGPDRALLAGVPPFYERAASTAVPTRKGRRR